MGDRLGIQDAVDFCLFFFCMYTKHRTRFDMKSTVHLCSLGICKGIARTQSPTNKNYALELPTFGVIVGVSPTGVQWRGLTLEEPPSWSWLTSEPGKYAVGTPATLSHYLWFQRSFVRWTVAPKVLSVGFFCCQLLSLNLMWKNRPWHMTGSAGQSANLRPSSGHRGASGSPPPWQI